jgi:hypothetical protein
LDFGYWTVNKARGKLAIAIERFKQNSPIVHCTGIQIWQIAVHQAVAAI